MLTFNNKLKNTSLILKEKVKLICIYVYLFLDYHLNEWDELKLTF